MKEKCGETVFAVSNVFLVQWYDKASSEEEQNKLPFERAFKIASEINFGFKMTSQSASKLFPKSVQKWSLPIGARHHDARRLWDGQERSWTPLGSILEPQLVSNHFRSDFGFHWDRFWSSNWCQNHETVKKFKVSLGHVQPKLRPSLDQDQHQVQHQIWTKFGSGLDKGQTKFKPNVDQVWTKVGLSLD